MKLADLEVGMGKVNVEVKVVDISEPRTFRTRRGTQGRVATATIEDDSGRMQMALWNEQIDQVNEGVTIRISNGYVSEFRGTPQLTTGRYGSLEVVEE